jgi:Leucine-rich repeat (LRR) protein
VRNCGLRIINDETFNECGNLRILDASFNDISHVKDTALRNCTKLEKIDLTGNPVNFVSNQLYVMDPNLKEILFNRVEDFGLN